MELVIDVDEIPLTLEREVGMPPDCPEIAVGFGMADVKDEKKSKAQGYPAFVQREVIRKVVPGDKNSSILKPSTEADHKRFPNAYKAFEDRKKSEQGANGYPIANWGPITKGMSYTLKAHNIHTVEALAAVSDAHVDAIGSHGRDLRAQARVFLKTSQDTAAVQATAAENEKLKAMLADMQRQITELAGNKRGPGRPRKDEEAAA